MNTLLPLLLIYVAALALLSLRTGREAPSSSSFLTGNARAGTLLCALSLVSTIIGGSATIGMGSLAQKTGAAAFWWLGVGAIGLVAHGLFIAPKIRAMKAVTLPEVLGELVGPSAERWAGIIIAVAWVGVAAAQFSALRLLLESLAPGAASAAAYAAVSAAVVLHTVLGGQRGVLRTDAMQALLLIGGFSAALLWALLWGGGREALSHADLVPFNAHFTGWDWLKMMVLVGITYVVGPDMFSRTFSAKDGSTARRAALAASPLLAAAACAVTLLAMINLDAASPISDWLSAESPMPAAIKAALAIGLVSALCGSADTILLSASGIAARDLLRSPSRGAIRAFALVFGLGAAVAAFAKGDVIGCLLYAYAFYVPGVAVPLLAVLWGRSGPVSERLWLAGAVSGGVLGLASQATGTQGLAFLGCASAAVLAAAARGRAQRSAALER